MEFELYNPSDPYTFVAEDREVAALVVGHLSLAFGAGTKDENDENNVPVFIFGGFDEWYTDTFGRTPTQGLEARKKEVGKALLSFMLGHFEDRRRYEAALRAIDDPDKREAFMAEWQDGRSSLNDIGTVAHSIGKNLLKSSGAYDKALEAAGKIDPDNLQDMIKAGRCGPIVAVSQC